MVPPICRAAVTISVNAWCARSRLPGSVGVEEDARVQVAVARVAGHDDLEAVPGGDGLAGADQVGEPADRHADVLEVARALGLQRRAERAPAGEQQVGLGRVVGHGHVHGARVGEQRGIPLHVLGRCGPGGRTGRAARPRSPAGSRSRRATAPPPRRRGRAARRARARGARGAGRRWPPRRVVERVEGRQHGEGGVGCGQQPGGDLGDDAEGALGADEQAGEVEPGDPLGGAVPGADAPRRRAAPPGGRARSRPVTPYFTQHRPPALVATLPPMVQNAELAGSGG